MLSVAPLVKIITDRWQVTLAKSALLISIFGFTQMALSLPSGWVADKKGFRLPILAGTTILALGMFLRPMAKDYSSFLFYSIIAALGWGLIWGPAGAMLKRWFPPQELGLANSIWLIGLIAGLACGTLTSIPLMLSLGWPQMWWVHSIIAVCITILAWFLIKSPPDLPESKPYVKGKKIEKNFLRLMNQTNIALQFPVIIAIGVIGVTPALVSIMLSNNPVSPVMAGIISSMILIGAILGDIIIPVVSLKEKRAKRVLLLLSLLATIFFILIFYTPVDSSTVWKIGVLNLLLGFFIAPVIAVSISLGQLQPYVSLNNAGFVTGVFQTSIGIGTAIFPLLIGYVADIGGLRSGVLTQGGFIIASFVIITLFVKIPQTN